MEGQHHTGTQSRDQGQPDNKDMASAASNRNKLTAIRRMTRDIRVVQNDRLDEQGIFINVDADNPFHVRALIIGPEDTPYAYGNYLFDMHFPNDTYPHTPPKVSYETRSGHIRFNPNLYCCGKVCLSILNTWQGPQWTSCQSLKSILQSIQTDVLTSTPLHNEPGYERMKKDHPTYVRYNRIIEHANFNVAILKMFDCPPEGFDVFLPIMREKFLHNAPRVTELLQRCIEQQPETSNVECKVYGGKNRIDFPRQLDGIHTLIALFTSSDGVKSATEPLSSSSATMPVYADSSTTETGIVADDEGSASDNAFNMVPTAAVVETGCETTVETPVLLDSVEPLPKKAKRAYHRKKRPATKARDHVKGYTESVYDSTLDKTFTWSVTLDKRGRHKWSLMCFMSADYDGTNATNGGVDAHDSGDVAVA